MTIELTPRQREAVTRIENLHADLGHLLDALRGDPRSNVSAVAVQTWDDGDIPGRDEAEADIARMEEEWFLPGYKNRHLSDKGIAHLRRLYDQGINPNQAGIMMGIKRNAAQYRYDQWDAERGE